MRIRRTIPPAAAPVGLTSLLSGAAGLFSSRRYLRRVEREIKDYFGVRHVFLLSSGKAAFFIILDALSRLAPERRKVLVPAYTCYSVPSAIMKARLDVSLCDIDSLTFDFDGAQLADAVDDKTLCVVPNHLFGIPSDLDLITRTARARGVFIVEDAAQAMGGSWKGRKLGTVGDVGFFSLGRGKNITCGSGGVIITNNDRIAAAVEEGYRRLPFPSTAENVKDLVVVSLMSVCVHPSLYWLPAGMPFLRLGETIFDTEFPVHRLSGVKAGLLLRWRTRLERSNQKRIENSVRLRMLNDRSEACQQPTPFLRYPVLAENRTMRDHMIEVLNHQGLGASRMYPASVNQIKELRAAFDGSSFPTAEDVAERILTLPTHELLNSDDGDRLFSALSAFMPLLAHGPGEQRASSCREGWEGLVRL